MNENNQDKSSSASYDVLVEKRLRDKAERLRLDQEYRSKHGDTGLSERWFVRYPLSCFILLIAFVFYKMWLEGFKVQGVLHIFVNPIAPAVFTVIALVNTWELTLAVVILAMLYFLSVGLAAIPVSAAVIVGSLLIACAIVKLKN